MRRTATASSSAACQQRARAGAARRAQALRLRPDADRRPRRLHDEEAERAGHVFIHGGAWRVGLRQGLLLRGRDCSSTPARTSSCSTSSTSIEAGGDLMPMADQVRRAVAWVYKNAESFGGDPNRIYVSGHSSGGHLAGVLLTTDWEKDFGVPTDIIKGGAVVLAACTTSSRCGCRSARSLRQIHRRDGG